MVLRWPRAARPPRHTRPRLGAAARRSGGHPRRDHAGLLAYIAMFVSGEWITSKEGLGGEDDPAWFVIGIVVGDLTGLLLAVSIVLAGIASWKSKARLGRAARVLTTLVLVPCVVAVWAMTAKPT
jgi:hypothetical protein